MVRETVLDTLSFSCVGPGCPGGGGTTLPVTDDVTYYFVDDAPGQTYGGGNVFVFQNIAVADAPSPALAVALIARWTGTGGGIDGFAKDPDGKEAARQWLAAGGRVNYILPNAGVMATVAVYD